jgi:ABC-type lipoprotein release transport system permease subunit
VKTALAAAGLTAGSTESLAERRAELDRDGTALALLLFLVAAVVATVLSTGTVLALSYVSGRRRSYELAALRSLGAPTRVLVRAGRREQVFLVVVGVLLGTVTGVAATLATLTALPAITGAGRAPVERAPEPLPVVLFVVAVLALVTVVAHLGARHVVAGARADLLRESQA